MENSNISEHDAKSKSFVLHNHNISLPSSKPTRKTDSTPHLIKTENLDKKLTKKQSSYSNTQGSFNENSINSCLICFENQPDAVFMDCGHGGMCYSCATDIFKKTGECHLCRKEIKQVLLLDFKSREGNIIRVKESIRVVNEETSS